MHDPAQTLFDRPYLRDPILLVWMLTSLAIVLAAVNTQTEWSGRFEGPRVAAATAWSLFGLVVGFIVLAVIPALVRQVLRDRRARRELEQPDPVDERAFPRTRMVPYAAATTSRRRRTPAPTTRGVR